MLVFAPIPQPLTPSGGKGSFNIPFGGVTSAALLRLGAFLDLGGTSVYLAMTNI